MIPALAKEASILAIERTVFPREYEYSDQPSRLWGGQYEWFWGVPDTLRAAAGEHGKRAVPATPRSQDPLHQWTGYWGALQTVLMYRLGWTRPDLGLAWWYETGKPTDDPTLRLISEVWDSDGNLDTFLGWLLLRGSRYPVGTSKPTWVEAPTNVQLLPNHWQRWMREIGTSARVLNQKWFSLDSSQPGDSLHLSSHLGEGGTPDSSAYLAPVAFEHRRAVFVTSAADAWYVDLKNRGDELPVIGVQSWKVDVFVKPIGYLGTYRRSMQTGLWFTGRHRYHAAGN
ncbi:hypothetical protein [Rathayibacter sp. AY1C1]|uniref:hypothetical protein n=1 Tax=Rathayibacter sp. AY1C1 TaxID=2080534 RepID=UPI0011B0CC18|nr:hypothetical protein [Rathayibacter sp. AY1C1]